MTQDVSRSTPNHPMLWEVNEKRQVKDKNEEAKLDTTITFILENYTWVQQNRDAPLAFELCHRLFKTIPPEHLQGTMDVAKEILVQTVDERDLLSAILPSGASVTEMENPITQNTQRFITINLKRFSPSDVEPIKTALSTYPELGINVVGAQNLKLLEGLSKAFPKLRALRCPGIMLEMLPFDWKENVEWLFCTFAERMESNNFYPQLKGLIAPKVKTIALVECHSLEAIHAPLLERLELSATWRLPKITCHQLRTLQLKNCQPIECIETDALKLICDNLPHLKSIIAPKAKEIACMDSAAVEKLHALEAESVHLKDYASFKDVDLSKTVRFYRALETSVPLQESQASNLMEIEAFLKSNSLADMDPVVRHNPINGTDQVYLLLEPYNGLKLSALELKDLQRAFSAYPDLGLMVRNHHLASLDELSQFIPAPKGLCVFMGMHLEKIPESWRRSVEWLHCISSGLLIVPDFPNLKGLIALTTQIIQCEKASMDVIIAPQLTRIHLIQPRKSPVIRSDKSYNLTKS